MAQHFITASNLVLAPLLEDSHVEGFHVYTNGIGQVDGMAAINARKYLGYIQLPGYDADYMVALSITYGPITSTRHSSLDDAIGYMVSAVGTVDDSHLDLKYGMLYEWTDYSTYGMAV